MEEKSINNVEIVKQLIKNLILEMIITTFGMFILAVVLSKTNLNENIMGNAIIAISSFAIGFGGFRCSRILEIKGILCGAIQGIIYMAILYLISSVLNGKFYLGIEGIIMIIVRNYFWKYWRNYRC